MMTAPAFWRREGWKAKILAPLSVPVAFVTTHRARKVGWTSPVPVICCGNASVGGAGKTTIARDLARRLTARGLAVHILLRGYGGSARGPRRVSIGDPPALTGDEALLLAASAPTWTGADRAASARAAVMEGADVLVMDDGLQNPSLAKSMSLLVVDGATGFGNGRVLPAGPLREPVAATASRCRAAVLIGSDDSGALAQLGPGLPVLRADLEQSQEVATLMGRRVLAFAGIAFPEKFFSGLERRGVLLAGKRGFPDHHPFTAKDLADLVAEAKALGAVLVTTPKDAVRLPAEMAVHVVDVTPRWRDEAEIEALIDELLSGRRPRQSFRP